MPSCAFRGEHQAGIVTPAQDRLHIAAFDVVTDSREELVALLESWTDAAEQMTRGEPVGATGALEGDLGLPPDDTGEALGLPASGLTVTVGYGPSLFRDADGRDRFGLADRQPRALRDLPHSPADVLEPERSGGDLCVQACADDPQVAVHAVRNLARIGFEAVSVRWSQLGFGLRPPRRRPSRPHATCSASRTGRPPSRPRRARRSTTMSGSGATTTRRGSWLVGGSYLVARRINMTIEVWDRQPLVDQEVFVGRTKGKGTFSGGEEFTPPDFAMPGSNGQPVSQPTHTSGWSTLSCTAAYGCCGAATTSSTAATPWAG